MKREMVCICCPIGCRLLAEVQNDGSVAVTGHTCPRGKQYAIDEMTAPKRMVTASVKVTGGRFRTVSVKTSVPVDKARIFDALGALEGTVVAAPIAIGQVIVTDAAGTGVDFVATRQVDRA